MPLLVLLNDLIQDELGRKGHLNHMNTESVQFAYDLALLARDTAKRRALIKIIKSGNLKCVCYTFVTH